MVAPTIPAEFTASVVESSLTGNSKKIFPFSNVTFRVSEGSGLPGRSFILTASHDCFPPPDRKSLPLEPGFVFLVFDSQTAAASDASANKLVTVSIRGSKLVKISLYFRSDPLALRVRTFFTSIREKKVVGIDPETVHDDPAPTSSAAPSAPPPAAPLVVVTRTRNGASTAPSPPVKQHDNISSKFKPIVKPPKGRPIGPPVRPPPPPTTRSYSKLGLADEPPSAKRPRYNAAATPSKYQISHETMELDSDDGPPSTTTRASPSASTSTSMARPLTEAVVLKSGNSPVFPRRSGPYGSSPFGFSRGSRGTLHAHGASPLSDPFAFASSASAPPSPTARRGARLEGMANVGNSCYQNAVLAALLALPPVTQILRQVPPPAPAVPPTAANRDFATTAAAVGDGLAADADEPKRPLRMTRSAAAAAAADTPAGPPAVLTEILAGLLAQRTERPGTVLNPLAFHQGIVGRAGSTFANGRQEDAQELLTECLSRIEHEVPPFGRDLVRVFQGQDRRTLTCAACAAVVTINEEHRGWSLDVVSPTPSEPMAIRTLLERHFATEGIEYKCEKCNHTQATVATRLAAPPHVLVIHFKRFAVDPITLRARKRQDPVKIALSVDVSPFLTEPEPETAAASAAADSEAASEEEAKKPPAAPKPAAAASSKVYRLYAIVNHLGTNLDRGHYICDVRGPRGQWQTHDDAMVTDVRDVVDLVHQRERTGYLLFYMMDS
ncbi:hypothetical protein H9P43_002757 [Blastocladiella emersonii ATCC 22665]|nr:hypothetical protein H9P43_002757 [Blastocladiella emersonii ATCC 22665]